MKRMRQLIDCIARKHLYLCQSGYLGLIQGKDFGDCCRCTPSDIRG